MYINLPWLYAFTLFNWPKKPKEKQIETSDKINTDQLRIEKDKLILHIEQYQAALNELSDQMAKQVHSEDKILRIKNEINQLQMQSSEVINELDSMTGYQLYKQEIIEKKTTKFQWFLYSIFGVLAVYSGYSLINTIFRFNNLKDVKK